MWPEDSRKFIRSSILQVTSLLSMITSAAELTIATDTSFSFTEQHLQLQPTLCRTQWILRRKTKVLEGGQDFLEDWILWLQHGKAAIHSPYRSLHGRFPHRKQSSWLAILSWCRGELGLCSYLARWRSRIGRWNSFGAQPTWPTWQPLLHQ